MTDPSIPITLAPADVAQRLDAFGATKDPAALWPTLSEARRVAAARELERVTRAVLAGAHAIALDPDTGHSPYALGVAGHTTGMGPVIGRWIERGIVTASDRTSAFFAEHLISGRSRNARIEREVLPAIDALLAHGVTPVVLKGFHTSRVYFDEIGTRPMADVDLLIDANEVATAEAALESAGFRPDSAPLRPYKRDWIGVDVDDRVYSVERSDPRSKWALELHASLDRVYHPGATARLNQERQALVPLEIASRSLSALAPELLVTYLACHCSQELDSIRLLRVYELINVIGIERAAGRLDWDRVNALIERTGSAAFTYPAFSLVEDLAPNTIDRRALGLGRAASTSAARHTVERLAPAGGSLDDRAVLRQMMWTRGPVGVLQRLMRTVWPAAFDRPEDVIPGWRVRLRRLRQGIVSFRAPDERS